MTARLRQRARPPAPGHRPCCVPSLSWWAAPPPMRSASELEVGVPTTPSLCVTTADRRPAPPFSLHQSPGRRADHPYSLPQSGRLGAPTTPSLCVRAPGRRPDHPFSLQQSARLAPRPALLLPCVPGSTDLHAAWRRSCTSIPLPSLWEGLGEGGETRVRLHGHGCARPGGAGGGDRGVTIRPTPTRR